MKYKKPLRKIFACSISHLHMERQASIRVERKYVTLEELGSAMKVRYNEVDCFFLLVNQNKYEFVNNIGSGPTLN